MGDQLIVQPSAWIFFSHFHLIITSCISSYIEGHFTLFQPLPVTQLNWDNMKMETERQKMFDFWTKQSNKPESSFIPEDVSSEEVTEIISLLPSFQGKHVLELGSGTGRFTSLLSKQATSVKAIDFIQSFTDQNKKNNGSLGNISFECCDCNELDLPEKSVDVVFCNWLFMYMGDEESRSLLKKSLKWLKDDGYLFFRESCFHQSGNETDRAFNPTHYRVPADYMNMVESVYSENDGKIHGFNLVLSRSIQAYAKRRKNNNQICWLVTKDIIQESSNQGYKTFQQFLDAKQYSRNGILRYEKIFGRHFVSTGGRETTQEFVDMLDLRPGQAVLDIGAGIGGSAFYMAEKHDVTVLAMDLSANMINIGLERANEIGDLRVQFEISDATKREYGQASFDVVYSRDTILHIEDKKSLFASFYRWLKPGGKLLISDYCCGEGELSPEYKEYVKGRGYHVVPVKTYGKILESVGFSNVRAEDKNDLFTSVLQRELKRTEEIKDDFINEFSQADYDAIVDGWKEKLVRVGQGDQRWGLFYAEKLEH